MVTIKQILVPTDFSEDANLAFDCAKPLADVFGASLQMMQDPLMQVPNPEAHVVVQHLVLMEDLGRHARQALDGLREVSRTR